MIESPRLSSFGINVQTILAFHESGKDNESLKVFNSSMNVPQLLMLSTFSINQLINIDLNIDTSI